MADIMRHTLAVILIIFFTFHACHAGKEEMKGLVRISGEELASIYKEAVLEKSPWKGKGEIVIKDIKTPRYVMAAEKERAGLQAVFSPDEDFMGLTTATFSLGTGSSRLCRVSGKIHVMTELPVVKKNIPRGVIITEEFLEVKPYDISISPLIVADRKACLGMRTKTMIPAGKPVLSCNIERPPLISRGDLVAIEARSGGLVVQDKGIALKDGLLNERIPIRNASSGKQIVGTIIAHSQVEVTF